MKKQRLTIKFITIIVLFWFAQYVYIPYQTPFLTAINVASNLIGLVVGAYGLSQLLLRIPIGMLADWYLNHKLLIIFGTSLSGFASLIRLVFPNGIGFLIGNIISGIASSTWLSFMLFFLKINTKNSKVENMAILVMFNNIGMLLGFIISGIFYGQFSMSGLCLFSIIAGILAFALSITLPDVAFSTNSGQNLWSNFFRVVKNKTLLICGLLAFIQQGVQMSTTMSFTTQVIKEIHAPEYSEGLSSIIFMMAAVIFAQITSSRLLSRFSKKGILIVSYILLAIYCFLVPITNNIYLIYFLQLIPGIGTGTLFAILNAVAISEVPQAALSTATGFFQSIYALGMTLFPIIAGQLRAKYSMITAFYVLGIASLIGGFIVLLFGDKKPKIFS